MERSCRLFAFFVLGCFIILTAARPAAAAIELHVDGRVITSRPALALLGTGLGLALPILEEELGFTVDDSTFPVVSLTYGTRLATVVADDRRAVLNGQRIELQVAPRVQGDVLFVPLHLVADMAGLRVDWDIVSGTLKMEHRSAPLVAATPAAEPPRVSATPAATSSTDPPATLESASTPPIGVPTSEVTPDTTPAIIAGDAATTDVMTSSESPSTPTSTGTTPALADTPESPAIDASPAAGPAIGATPGGPGAADTSTGRSAGTWPLEPGAGGLRAEPGAETRAHDEAMDSVASGEASGEHEPPSDQLFAVAPSVLHQVGLSVVNGRVQLDVGTDKDVEPHVMFIPNPARLVVDIPDAVLAAGWQTMQGDGHIVEQVRASATEDGGVRLVADLTGPTGYELQEAEHGRGFVVRLNHQIRGLSVEPTASGGLAMHVRATGRLDYSVFVLREPTRIVVDLAGATVEGPQEIPLTSQFASSVRVSQYEHDVVRAVVELKGSASATLFTSRLAEAVRGEVHPGVDGTFSLLLNPLTGVAIERHDPEPASGSVRSVAVLQQDGTEFVLIEADTPLDPELRRFREPERLVLDLPDVQLDRSLGLTTSLPEDGVVVTVRAGQAEPRVSRIVVETGDIVEHHLFLSPDGRRAVLALRRSQLGGRTVVVDPGHGGRDPGAIGYSGTYEKDVTLSIGLLVAGLLEQAGATVVLTRHEDVFVELANRSALANAVGADAFVSIHADAIGFGRIASGTSTFYYPENGSPDTSINRRYAQSLQSEMLSRLGLDDRGVQQRAFHVVRNTAMPSALVEVGFIDNPEEERLLLDPDFQAKAAAGIVHGILRFFAEEEQLAVPDARQLWQLASEQAVNGFLHAGELPGDAIALVPTAVLGALPEPAPQDAGF